jgi:pyruvate/2-oxoglutarate dehydrogenase complex dihydrolipoamide dehydrogenase (E3) component
MNERCTAARVEEERPDVVVVATGAVPLIPDLPGIDGNNVATAIDIITGKKQAGQNVVIVGGGATGCETAELLTQKGKQVTVLEMQARIGSDYGPMNRWVVIDRLVEAGIRLETGVKAEEITDKGVKVIRAGQYPEFFEADTVILALGMVSIDEVASDLEGKIPTIFKIGDAYKPAGFTEAIESGFKIGFQI